MVADLALHCGLVAPERMLSWSAGRAGRPGIARLRRVLELAEPRSESPMETRLRLILVLARLPRPEAQVDLRDASGAFVARADLYYRQRRLAIEYDGGIHRAALVEDNRRQNRILSAGYQLLRFTAGDIAATPGRTVALVRAALAAPHPR